MTRELNSRTANTRENGKRKLEFEEPNWLDIPETIRQRFANSGNSLRWIRITIKNEEDYQNIGKRLSEGWEFVQADEVPELMATSFVREGGRYSGAICRGDLALAKMPTELAESRQRFYENRSREMVQAVNSQLLSNSDSRMPISVNSKTNVSRGKSPAFQD